MDFLRQHMFRQTLLCRQGIPVQRELALEQFADLAYHASLQPVEPPDLRRAVAQSFRGPDGGTCEVIHPLAKAALLELGERHPDALAFSDLVTRARLRLQAEGGDDTVPDEDLLMELVRLYLHQQIGASPEAEQVPRAGLNRPCASGLARAQAAAGNGHVSTRRHKPMGIDAFVTALLRHLHGRHHRSELADLLYEDVVAGRLELDHEIPAGAALRSAMQANVGRMLAMLAHHGVLEPEDEGQG